MKALSSSLLQVFESVGELSLARVGYVGLDWLHDPAETATQVGDGVVQLENDGSVLP